MICVPDSIQTEVLVDLQGLLGCMARDELDLRIGQAIRGQVGEHLVAEQVRVDVPGYAGLGAVRLDDLLDTSRGELRVVPGFEQVGVLFVGAEVGPERQAESLGEQDVAIFVSLALANKYLTLININVGDLDIDQFTDPYAGRVEQLQHDLVLYVATPLDRGVEALEIGLSQQLRQRPGLLGLAQSGHPPRPLAAVDEGVVVEVLPADESGEMPYEPLVLGFRFSIWSHEVIGGCGRVGHGWGPLFGGSCSCPGAYTKHTTRTV